MDKRRVNKLKDLESEFLEYYPKGFEDEELLKVIKRFRPQKLEEECKELFKKQNFSQPELICNNFIKIVSKSPLISLFEKPKLRDCINAMGMYEKDMFSLALEDLLYKDKKIGFESLVEILVESKLAKWTIITLVPYYINRSSEYFIKPTTTKDILKYFEIENIVYKPKANYEFYSAYKNFLDELKSHTNKSLTQDNAAFTGFLRISLRD